MPRGNRTRNEFGHICAICDLFLRSMVSIRDVIIGLGGVFYRLLSAIFVAGFSVAGQEEDAKEMGRRNRGEVKEGKR